MRTMSPSSPLSPLGRLATSIKRQLRNVREAVRRRGGGWVGVFSLVRRSAQIFRSFGIRGFIRWFRSRHETQLLEHVAPNMSAPVEPASIEDGDFRIGVVAHIFYSDLVREISESLERIPVRFSLFVSVPDEQTREKVLAELSITPKVDVFLVHIVPNRGRDIAPLLTSFRKELLELDIFLHLHTKKSLYAGYELREWRHYLFDSLTGSTKRIEWILGMFKADPQLGLVFPESYQTVRLDAHTWRGNITQALDLGSVLGINIQSDEYLDFPAGSMFWARTSAISTLLELNLSVNEFPEENGQVDGTIHHAIERIFAKLSRSNGFQIGILPSDSSLSLYTESERNWRSYFTLSVSQKIDFSSVDSKIFSFDIFDTLVVRKFLTPSGTHAFLEHLVEKKFQIPSFGHLRSEAQRISDSKFGASSSIASIYKELAHLGNIDRHLLDEIMAMELEVESRSLCPRKEIVASATRASTSGKKVLAISDMYIGKAKLRHLLPEEVVRSVGELLVSCETGWRKDTGDAWSNLPEQLGIEANQWTHLGDNEYSDVDVPERAGVRAVHVLRPRALLDVVPALRALRPSRSEEKSWSNQLLLGLLANRWTEQADESPELFGRQLLLKSPDVFGYLAFGPLLLTYTSWLSRLVLARERKAIAFLSREGHLLRSAFSTLRDFVPALSSVSDHYLLVSRRAAGFASLREASDLRRIFQGVFSGSLHDLLVARLGTDVARMAEENGIDARSQFIVLPEMMDSAIDLIRPLEEKILAAAASERTSFSAYLDKTIASSDVVLSDIGYSATIQSHLSYILDRPFLGAYFATTKSARASNVKGNETTSCFFDESIHGPRVQSTIFRNDLLIESIMMSQQSQLSHFSFDDDGAPQPIFIQETRTELNLIAHIQNGALNFVADAANAVGAEILAFDPCHKLAQQPLELVERGDWKCGDWALKLSIDDAYTGRGVVPPY